MLENGTLTDSIALSYDLQLVARDAAETFGVPYRLLLAVMFRESSYNPEAENGICYGLMQIHQMNFEWQSWKSTGDGHTAQSRGQHQGWSVPARRVH